jgi:hypothetical protein
VDRKPDATVAKPAVPKPMAPPPPRGLEVSVDTSEAPELAKWGQLAKVAIEKAHPIIALQLRSDGYTPPREIRLVFKKRQKRPGFTRGNQISLSADWVKANPNGGGLVIHHLVRVIQAYPSVSDANRWLAAGIADYFRYSIFEAMPPLKLKPGPARYRQGSRLAALFLAWVVRVHDRDLIRKVNAALRQDRYTDDLFRVCTKRTLDQLWDQFAKGKRR